MTGPVGALSHSEKTVRLCLLWNVARSEKPRVREEEREKKKSRSEGERPSPNCIRSFPKTEVPQDSAAVNPQSLCVKLPSVRYVKTAGKTARET